MAKTRFVSLLQASAGIDGHSRRIAPDMVRDVFQRNCLGKGNLYVRVRRVELQAIERTALATIEGEEDDISAPRQTSIAHALCPGIPKVLRRKLTVPGSGHFSLFHGEKARSTVYCNP